MYSLIAFNIFVSASKSLSMEFSLQYCDKLNFSLVFNIPPIIPTISLSFLSSNGFINFLKPSTSISPLLNSITFNTFDNVV